MKINLDMELADKKLIKTTIVLYVMIFVLIVIDVIGDYKEGAEWGHISIELVVLLIALWGIGFLGYGFYQATQSKLSKLKSRLDAAQAEAEIWRNESRDLIAGLGVEIQKQFSRWGLSSAEAEVGLLLLKGFSLQEIADLRQSSERTVREQARAIYRKSGTAGRSGLSAFFLEDLLLPLSQ